MQPAISMLTLLPTIPPADEIPAVFPSPFLNQPHPLAERAARLLQQRLLSATDDMEKLLSTTVGKMFGVLVVRNQAGDIGYLSAFSGMAGGTWHIPGFVPPLFDEARHHSFLPAGKAKLAELSGQIAQLESSARRAWLKEQIALLIQQRHEAMTALKLRHRNNRELRKAQRLTLTENHQKTEHMAALALASQHDKREATDMARAWNDRLRHLQQQLEEIEQTLQHLITLRSEQSRALHQQVFSTYMLHNFANQKQTILHFFSDSTPPAGAGGLCCSETDSLRPPQQPYATGTGRILVGGITGNRHPPSWPLLSGLQRQMPADFTVYAHRTDD